MPKQVELKVIVGGLGSQGILRDDVMTIGKYTGKVVQVEEKQTWAFITLRTEAHDKQGTSATGHKQQVTVTAGNVRRKLPLNSEINVTREVPTDEEDLANDLSRFLASTQNRIEEANTTLNAAMRRLNSKWEEGKKKGWANPFDLDWAMTVAQAQARNAIWQGVQADIIYLMGKGERLEIAAAKAVLSHQEQAKRYLLAPFHHRVLSRSTSLSSNLMDDMTNQAYAEFLDSFRYEDQARDLLVRAGIDVKDGE